MGGGTKILIFFVVIIVAIVFLLVFAVSSVYKGASEASNIVEDWTASFQSFGDCGS